MLRYAHLAIGNWEVNFLSNPDYVNWLDSTTTSQPLAPYERLVDYVRQRLPPPTRPPTTNSNGSYPSQQARPYPPSSSSSSSSLANFASAPAPSTQSPLGPFASFSTMNNLNGSSSVDFSDLIDYSALGDDGDSSASYAAALESSFAPNDSGVGGLSAQPSLNHEAHYSAFSAPPPSSSSTIPAVSGYPPSSMPSSSTYPTSSSASTAPDFVYSSISNPYAMPQSRQSPSYYSTPSVDPSSFFASRPTSSNSTNGQPAASSTLAMQSQLIQDERNRRNATMSMSPAPPFFNPTAAANATNGSSGVPQEQLPPPATTISPAMMTNPQFNPSPSPSNSIQPVASTSRAPSPPTSSVPSTKKASSSSSSSKPRSTSSSSSSTSESVKRWNKVFPDIQASLTRSRLEKAPTSTAQRLISLISPFNHIDGPSSTLSDWSDGSDVPPEGRKSILTDLLKYAGEEFWKSWVEEGERSNKVNKSQGIEILRFWFEGASKGIEARKEKEKEKSTGKEDGNAEKKRREVEQMTLVLVLQVFAKLPITHRHLGNLATVAKRVKKISLKGDEGAVRAAATRLYDKWKKVQDEYNSTQQASSTSTSSKDKKPNGASSSSKDKDGDSAKRKSAGTDDASNKKPKITTTTTTTTKKVPSSYAPVAPTKLDAKLSFKKKPESNISAMRAALKTVNSKKLDAAAPIVTGVKASTPVAEDKKNVVGGVILGKNGKPKKQVRWNEVLEAVRIIEKAIYDDEDEGKTGLGLGEGEEMEENFKKMEEQEGMSLSMHLDEDEDMEEDIEWYEPVGVTIPDTEDFASLRQEPDSAEARIQTEREANLMEIDAAAEPRGSPNEPPEYNPPVPDPEPKVIPLSADLATDHGVLAEIAAAQVAVVPLGGFAENDQIESLLGQLNTSVVQAPQQAQPLQALEQIDPATLEALRGYDPEHVRQILETHPAFRGMTVENLGLGGPPPPPQQSMYPPQHAGGYGPPPPGGSLFAQTDPYAHPHEQSRPGWGAPANYGTPWQPSAPPPPDAYNGYQPPNQGYERAALPSQTATLKKGKRKTVYCKFFKTSRGCDWGDKCAFIHDSSQ
ncbi:hypothetical protein JCM16303_007315 [Sporobolomyces ruberrimus]